VTPALSVSAVSRRILLRTAIALSVCSAGRSLLPDAAAAQPSEAANPCAVIGYDEARVGIVLQALKAAAHSMTPDPIAPFIEYPFTARSSAGTIVIKSAKDMRRMFPRIFTARVRSAILSQNLDDAFSNYQGVMIGNGQVWIAEVCRDQQCRDKKYVVRTVNF
jgi:hypothetical protein